MAFKIELINYGGKAPTRAHYNDAGADVYSTMTVKIAPGQTEKIPLGIGVKIPDGYVALMTPRSGLSSKGIETAVGTIDSGYRGELSASVSNVSGASYTVKEGDRVGQLAVLPVALVDFTFDISWENERGSDGFGSTGK